MSYLMMEFDYKFPKQLKEYKTAYTRNRWEQAENLVQTNMMIRPFSSSACQSLVR